MSLATEHPNPIAVLDAVIADMRASGDTGHVENLLQARTDIANLVRAGWRICTATSVRDCDAAQDALESALRPFRDSP